MTQIIRILLPWYGMLTADYCGLYSILLVDLHVDSVAVCPFYFTLRCHTHVSLCTALFSFIYVDACHVQLRKSLYIDYCHDVGLSVVWC